jgi:hypothetical protein
MPNYQQGKIYKITSGDLTYIGSTTCSTVARRLVEHVSKFKGWKNGKGLNTTSFQLIETGNYEITLIELFPCNSKDELHARERFHIEANVCVNRIHPTRTKKEYYDEYKEQKKKQQTEYYHNIYKPRMKELKEENLKRG